jgi:hypothetical protein
MIGPSSFFGFLNDTLKDFIGKETAQEERMLMRIGVTVRRKVKGKDEL